MKKVRFCFSDNEQETEPCQELQTRIYLCMVLKNKLLSAAYYDPEQAILYVMKDEWENEPFDLARFGMNPKIDQIVIEQVKPNVILTHSRVDDGFIAFLNGNLTMNNVRACKTTIID